MAGTDNAEDELVRFESLSSTSMMMRKTNLRILHIFHDISMNIE